MPTSTRSPGSTRLPITASSPARELPETGKQSMGRIQLRVALPHASPVSRCGSETPEVYKKELKVERLSAVHLYEGPALRCPESHRKTVPVIGAQRVIR